MSRPWTSHDIPPLVVWLETHHEAIDLLVEASSRPRLYWPSPTLLNGQVDTVLEMYVDDQWLIHDAASALAIRAMWHLGEGRSLESWNDLVAIHRLARLSATGPTLRDQLLAFRVDHIAYPATLAHLGHENLTTDEAMRIQQDLRQLPPFTSVVNSIDGIERIIFLDGIEALRSGRAKEFLEESQVGPRVAHINKFNVDWNVVLRRGNEWFDRLAAAMRLPTYQARGKSLDRAFDETQQEAKQHTSGLAALIAPLMSRQTRNRYVSDIAQAVFNNGVFNTHSEQEHANARSDLLNVAAALAMYRAENGVYPQRLDDLLPAILSALPVDHFNSLPFVYRPIGDGYLLYSRGPNGTDARASNELRNILEGNDIDRLDEPAQFETAEKAIPAGADDVAIRIPVPAFELPSSPHSDIDSDTSE